MDLLCSLCNHQKDVETCPPIVFVAKIVSINRLYTSSNHNKICNLSMWLGIRPCITKLKIIKTTLKEKGNHLKMMMGFYLKAYFDKIILLLFTPTHVK